MRSVHPRQVALVEDHRLLAQALTIALEAEGYEVIEVPLTTANGHRTNLPRTIARTHARTVLLDLNLGVQGDGARLIRGLTENGMAVVVLTASTDRARWGQCLSYGALKVIPKRAALTDTLATIARIENGLPVMPADERERLLEEWRQRLDATKELRDRLDRLTPREAEVLSLLMDGKQVADIATEQFVSESTVRTQVKSILAKLQVNSQLTAVGLAHKAHWHMPKTGGPTRGARHRGAEDSSLGLAL